MMSKCVIRVPPCVIIASVLFPVITSFSQSLEGKTFAAVIQAMASDGLGVQEYQVC